MREVDRGREVFLRNLSTGRGSEKIVLVEFGMCFAILMVSKLTPCLVVRGKRKYCPIVTSIPNEGDEVPMVPVMREVFPLNQYEIDGYVFNRIRFRFLHPMEPSESIPHPFDKTVHRSARSHVTDKLTLSFFKKCRPPVRRSTVSDPPPPHCRYLGVTISCQLGAQKMGLGYTATRGVMRPERPTTENLH